MSIIFSIAAYRRCVEIPAPEDIREHPRSDPRLGSPVMVSGTIEVPAEDQHLGDSEDISVTNSKVESMMNHQR